MGFGWRHPGLSRVIAQHRLAIAHERSSNSGADLDRLDAATLLPCLAQFKAGERVYTARKPPSTGNVTPLTYEAMSEARNTMGPTSSSG
jgi:hypothetical protein